MSKNQKPLYVWDTDYTYNVFNADEHFCVTLYRLTKKGHYKEVNTWSYSTFMKSRIAHAQGERRIRKLAQTYGAVPYRS